MTDTSGPDESDAEVTPSPRRRRRAVGPAGAAAAEPLGAPRGWSAGSDEAEDDDERLLREVPPHHGG